MDSSNYPQDPVSNLVNYESSENSQDGEINDSSSSEQDSPRNSAGPSVSRAETRGEVSKNQADSSLTDEFSDDESICRSPTKSPLKKPKLSEVLKRKQTLGQACEDEDLSSEETETSPEKHIPTDRDFQFKEPKFRKKKFIFHPFRRNEENVCVPDSSRVNITSTREIIIPKMTKPILLLK